MIVACPIVAIEREQYVKLRYILQLYCKLRTNITADFAPSKKTTFQVGKEVQKVTF